MENSRKGRFCFLVGLAEKIRIGFLKLFTLQVAREPFGHKITLGSQGVCRTHQGPHGCAGQEIDGDLRLLQGAEDPQMS